MERRAHGRNDVKWVYVDPQLKETLSKVAIACSNPISVPGITTAQKVSQGNYMKMHESV